MDDCSHFRKFPDQTINVNSIDECKKIRFVLLNLLTYVVHLTWWRDSFYLLTYVVHLTWWRDSFYLLTYVVHLTWWRDAFYLLTYVVHLTWWRDAFFGGFSSSVSNVVPLRFVSFSRMFCRVVVGRPLLRGPSGFQSRTMLTILRHDASHDLPDEDAVVSRWWSVGGSRTLPVIVPRHAKGFPQYPGVDAVQYISYS